MNGRKIITILVIINIIFIGIIYNLISKLNINSQKQIIKGMTETEYENEIASLNESHENYINYIKESKMKIASAITDMGITTSAETTAEEMASNIRKISTNKDALSISYDNKSSGLASTNVQDAINEIDCSLDKIDFSKFTKADALYNATNTYTNGSQVTLVENIDYEKYKAIVIMGTMNTSIISTESLKSFFSLLGGKHYKITNVLPIYIASSNTIEPYYANFILNSEGYLSLYYNQYSFTPTEISVSVYGLY